MKFSKIVAASVAAVSMVAAAQAATFHIYVTGSTAFRSQAQSSMQNLYGAPIAQDNASLGSANNATFKKLNYPNAGDTTFVKAAFTGSGAGIQTVAGSVAILFYADTVTGTVGVPSTLTVAQQDSHVPDITFSDAYQGATVFTGGTYEDLTPQDNIVAVATFKWVGSKNFPVNGAGLYSMSPQIAQVLLPTGKIPLSFFTGNAADVTKIVFATGRNPDSGTRITAFAESGVGAFSTVKQWKPTITGQSGGIGGAVQTQVLYPIETINGVSTQFAGNSGENSGGTVRANITATIPSTVYNSVAQGGKASYTGAFYVTYLGVSDQLSVAANTTELTYNGVAFSEAAVQNGQYTFWGYEHIMYRAAAVGTQVATEAQALVGQITGLTSLTPNVVYTNMAVSRAADGAIVTAN